MASFWDMFSAAGAPFGVVVRAPGEVAADEADVATAREAAHSSSTPGASCCPGRRWFR